MLSRAIDSALSQSLVDQEIWVVDSGSTDDTRELLRSYGDRVGVLNCAHEGPGAARNVAIRAARGRYVVFLDSDDFWFPWTLETYLLALERHGWPAFIAGSHLDFRPPVDPTPADAAAFDSSCYTDYLSAAPHGDVWVLPGTAVVRADALRRVGGFATGFENGEDSDLWMRLCTEAPFVRIASPPVLAYRRHAGNTASSVDRTFGGAMRLVSNEIQGVYPGGRHRFRERIAVITSHTRPAALACLRAGLRREGWTLFRATLPWNARLLRWRFLVGFLAISGRTRGGGGARQTTSVGK